MDKETNHDLEKEHKNGKIRAKTLIPEIGKKLEQHKEELLSKTGMKKMFSELEVDDFISDLFYNSVKVIFDTFFNLAKNLNFDYLASSIEQAQKDLESE